MIAVKTFYALILLVALQSLHTQERMPLWKNTAPYSLGQEEKDVPTLTYFPASAQLRHGTSFLICPGGGYGHLAYEHEGLSVAYFFNQLGIDAYILTYRLGKNGYQHPVPLEDAKRALRMIRSRSASLNCDPQRIGVIGFSAGGHLSSCLATLHDEGQPQSEDVIERQSCRPNLVALFYPVINMKNEPMTNMGSRAQLLGKNPSPENEKLLSTQDQVSPTTPPIFLLHTTNDPAVSVDNTLVFYQACLNHKVPVEMHVYEDGPHGISLGIGHPALSACQDALKHWLENHCFLSKPPAATITSELKISYQGSIVQNGTLTLRSTQPGSSPISDFIRKGKWLNQKPIPLGKVECVLNIYKSIENQTLKVISITQEVNILQDQSILELNFE
jgi:acetyl esterase/lipase